MIGSFLYFIVLLVTSDPEITEPLLAQPTHVDTSIQVDREEKPIENVPSQTINSLVTISNSITPDMLKYKHWTGTYSPETFTLYINETLIESGETYTLASLTDQFIVRFNYSFMNGMRKGSKTFEYVINTASAHATITFSWLNPNKIIIDNATLKTDNTLCT